ncbi:hypothetical protein MCBRY_002982 [Methylocystis bryophila]
MNRAIQDVTVKCYFRKTHTELRRHFAGYHRRITF